MSRRRHLSSNVIVLIVIGLIVLSIVFPMVAQNIGVRLAFDEFFRANRIDSHRDMPDRYYGGKSIAPLYIEQLVKHKPVGWKILSVSGQPYPLNTSQLINEECNVLKAELYFEPTNFTAASLQPRGPFVKRTLPGYGEVVIVPIKLLFQYHPREATRLQVRPPVWPSGENWVAPWHPSFFDASTRNYIEAYFRQHPSRKP